MKWSSGPALKLMIGRTVGFAATFFIPLVLVRVFDPAAFGTYKQLFLLYATIFPLAQIGMAESLFYFLPSAKRRGGRFLFNATLALALSGTVSLLVLLALRHVIAGWMNNPDLAAYLPYIGVYLLFMLVASVLEITLISRNRYGAASLTYIGSDLVRAALLMLPALLFADLRWVIYGAVAFAALRVAAMLGWIRAEFGDRLRPNRRIARAQVAYTAPFQLAVVFEILQLNAPHFAVSSAFDPAVYAIYAIGCLQLPFIEFIASSVCNVLMVQMREAARQGNKRTMRRLWRAATRELAFVFVPLTVFLWIVAAQLITLLFTDAYAAAVPVFMIWTATILLSILQTDGILRATAQMRFLVRKNLLSLAVVAVALWLLIGPWGLEGAVVAAVLALAAGKGYALLRIREVIDAPFAQLLPLPALARITGATFVAAIPALLAGWLGAATPPPALGVRSIADAWPNLISLALVTATFWSIYLVAATWLDVLPESVRTALSARLSRFRLTQPTAAVTPQE